MVERGETVLCHLGKVRASTDRRTPWTSVPTDCTVMRPIAMNLDTQQKLFDTCSWQGRYSVVLSTSEVLQVACTTKYVVPNKDYGKIFAAN